MKPHDQITRADLLRKGAVGAAIGAAALAAPTLAAAADPERAQLAEIYQLQAAFHRAKSHQDINLMTSLWAPDATFINNGTLISGADAIRAFFLTTGSWKHHRMSFVPSFKEQIRLHGNEAFLYFECHDAALDSNDPGGPFGSLVTHLSLYGTVRNNNGKWQFQAMKGGPISLSVDKIFDT